jgi:glycine/D-amino acid oxidase-like deaminating enzyme
VGAGLAGCAVAWQAHWRGWTVALVDRADKNSASRVAAGLVTPITGTRGAASWRWQEFFPDTKCFYQSVEHQCQMKFWYEAPALRIFGNPEECQLYRDRWLDHASNDARDRLNVTMPNAGISVCEIDSHTDRTTIDGIHVPFGLCSMAPAARLNTTAYIESTISYFQSLGMYFQCNIDIDQDVDVSRPESIQLNSLALQANRLVLCQGFAARENSFFDQLPLHPARGDILTIESHSVRCDHVIHGQAWIVPTGPTRFLVGATYDRQCLNDIVDPHVANAMRYQHELVARWESMTSGTLRDRDHRMVDHRAAVRPASYDRHPLIGPHPLHPNLFCLNGLGSKGTLMAPRLAKLLLDSMDGQAIDRSLLWTRRK